MEKHSITDDRRKVFLDELARSGSFAQAAKAASPHSKSGAITSFRDLARRDPDFAAAADEATHEARGVVEAEIHRRAVEGVERVVYGRDGQPVGVERTFSDRLLELKARAILPEYRNHGTSINVGVQTNIGQLDVNMKDALAGLPVADQDALREILERAAAADRASIPDVMPPS